MSGDQEKKKSEYVQNANLHTGTEREEKKTIINNKEHIKITVNSKTYGKHEILIDREDFSFLKQYKWHLWKGRTCNTLYARTNIKKPNNKRTVEYMHRIIMEYRKFDIREKSIDHIDGNGLNNIKRNLRTCTNKQNQQNRFSRKGRSKYKGIYYHKHSKKWMVRVKYNGKVKFLGYFDNEIEAAKIYDNHAKELFGEFANLNFDEKEEK